MKKLILTLVLALTINSAHALASPAEVLARCVEVMYDDTCGAIPANVDPSRTFTVVGKGRVAPGAFGDYMAAYGPKVNGIPNTAMCQLAMQHMTLAPGSDHDVVARQLWTPPTFWDRQRQVVSSYAMSVAKDIPTTNLAVLYTGGLLLLAGTAWRTRRQTMKAQACT